MCSRRCWICMTICGAIRRRTAVWAGRVWSAIVNRNGGLQKGGLLEFVEPELILERMEDCVNPDLLDLREPEDLGYILRTLIILAVPVMYNGLRPGADPDGRKRLERVLQIVRRGMGAKPASAQQK